MSYERPTHRGKLIKTTPYSDCRQVLDPSQELGALSNLFPPHIASVLSPHIIDTNVTVKRINGQYFPSAIVRSDGADPTETSHRIIEQLAAIGQQPIFLEHGPGPTISTEVGALFRGPHSPITVASEPGFGIWGEAGISYMAGDECESSHPMLERPAVGIAPIVTTLTTEQILEHDVKLAGARSIAPTPGTVGEFLNAVKHRVISRGTISIVLSEVRTFNQKAQAAREQDLAAIAALQGEGYRVTDISVPTNDLNCLQIGQPGLYPDRAMAQALAALGPFDSNAMSIGVHPDVQLPPPVARIIVINKN